MISGAKYLCEDDDHYFMADYCPCDMWNQGQPECIVRDFWAEILYFFHVLRTTQSKTKTVLYMHASTYISNITIIHLGWAYAI